MAAINCLVAVNFLSCLAIRFVCNAAFTHACGSETKFWCHWLCLSATTAVLFFLQSIADRVKQHGDGDAPPEAVKHVAEAVKQLGIADDREE